MKLLLSRPKKKQKTKNKKQKKINSIVTQKPFGRRKNPVIVFGSNDGCCIAWLVCFEETVRS